MVVTQELALQVDQMLQRGLAGLDRLRSDQKNVQIDRAVQPILDNPSLLPVAIAELETVFPQEPYAGKFLARLTKPDNILSRMQETPYLMGVITQLDGPYQGWVEQQINALLSEPTRLFFTRKDPVSLGIGAKKALEIAFSYAKAALSLEAAGQTGPVQRMVELWEQHTLDGQKADVFSLAHLALFWGMDVDPANRYKAELVVSTMDVLGDKYTGTDANVDIFMRGFGQKVKTLRKIYRIKPPAPQSSTEGKKPSPITTMELENLADLINRLSNPELLKDEKLPLFGVFENIDESVRVITLSGKGDPLVVPPLKIPFADQVIKLKLQLAQSLLSQRGYESEIIQFPGRIFFLDWWRKENGQRIFKTSDLSGSLGHFLKACKSQGELVDKLNAFEVDALLRYLGPTIDAEKAVAKRYELSEKAKYGLRALSDRGCEIKFKLPEEQWLREMGLSTMILKQTDKGVAVRIHWGAFYVDFGFDRDFKPHGLSELAPAYQDWLSDLALTYIAAIRNPKVAKYSAAARKETHVPEAENISDKLDHVAYWRVLPVGHTWHQMETENPESKNALREEARDKFYTDIEELQNDWFEVQKDRNALANMSQPNRGYCEGFIERVEPRDSQPKWVPVGDKVPMVLGNPPVGLPPEQQYFQLAFVGELKSGKPEEQKIPMVVTCSGAAEELRALSTTYQP